MFLSAYTIDICNTITGPCRATAAEHEVDKHANVTASDVTSNCPTTVSAPAKI